MHQKLFQFVPLDKSFTKFVSVFPNVLLDIKVYQICYQTSTYKLICINASKLWILQFVCLHQTFIKVLKFYKICFSVSKFYQICLLHQSFTNLILQHPILLILFLKLNFLPNLYHSIKVLPLHQTYAQFVSLHQSFTCYWIITKYKHVYLDLFFNIPFLQIWLPEFASKYTYMY